METKMQAQMNLWENKIQGTKITINIGETKMMTVKLKDGHNSKEIKCRML